MNRLKIFLLVVVVAIIGIGFYFWWHNQTVYPSTNDAYLQANVLSISSEVNGTVAEVAVVENQHVETGDLLYRLDTAPFELSVKAAQAQLDIARQNASANNDNVQAASAQLASAQSVLDDADTALARNVALLQSGSVTQAAVDLLRSQQEQASAQVDAATATLAAAKSQAGAAAEDNASVKAAAAALGLANLDLGYAVQVASGPAWVANLTLRPNQVVIAGQPLFALVEDDEWWVDANFKETDLQRIRPGQPATISIDMYSGSTISGVVESIGAGSGAVFSLLPPQNATGNWVKVTQRFPVRIKLDTALHDTTLQLRVGASVTATVDTTGLAAGP